MNSSIITIKVTSGAIFLWCLFFIVPVYAVELPLDSDRDGLSDAYENLLGTDPTKIDTDADKKNDWFEVVNSTDPLSKEKKKFPKPLIDRDTDNDGLTDEEEINLGTDYQNTDSDSDGFLDGEEVGHGYSPLLLGEEKLEKRIEVSIATQTLSYFIGDLLIRSVKVSTGLPGYDTPKGEFDVLKKLPVIHYKGMDYDYPNTKWNMRFKFHKAGSYYIHGAYWHNQFGKKKSHGCVNVSYHDVERLYNWSDEGIKISIK